MKARKHVKEKRDEIEKKKTKEKIFHDFLTAETFQVFFSGDQEYKTSTPSVKTFIWEVGKNIIKVKTRDVKKFFFSS